MAAPREKVVHNAEKYVSRGKIESGIKEYRKLLADNPNDISTLNRVGDLYARINRNSEAIDLFMQIAEQYANDGFFVKAIAIYKKIIKLDPTLLEIYEKLADLYHRQGLVNEARSQYQVLADYYQKHDKTTSAVGIYQRMAELEPDDPSHHVRLAELYRKEGLTDRAMGEYRAIAELMLEHGRGGEAAQVFERALDVSSDDLGFITDAVLKLKEQGHVAAAARFLSLAVERNPAATKVAKVAGLGEGRAPAGPAAEAGEDEGTQPAVEDPTAAPPPIESQVEPQLEVQPEVQPEDQPGLETESWAAGEAEPVEGAPPPASDVEAGDATILDSGNIFVLDLDDEASDSLVTPPPDMLEDSELRGAAWTEREERRPAPPAEPPSAPEDDSFTGTFEFELDLDADGEGLLETVEEDAFPAAAAADGTGPLAGELDHDLLERTAAEVVPERITQTEDLLTEAEVLLKYGIEGKALERLSELLQREPDNLRAFQLMVGVHLEGGRLGRVASVAGELRAVAERLGDDEVWPAVRSELEAAGFRVEVDRIEPPPEEEPEGDEAVAETAFELETVPPEPLEPAPQEVTAAKPFELELDLDDYPLPAAEDLTEGFEVAEDVSAAEAEPPPEASAPIPVQADEPAALAEPPGVPAEPPEAASKRARKGLGDVEATLADLAGRFLGPRRKRQAPPAEAAASAGPALTELPSVPPPAAAPPPPAAPGSVDPLRALGDSLREEIDLASEAEGEEEAVTGAGPEGGGDLDDTGVSWLDEVSASAPGETGLEDEDAFFDLGAELEQELSAEDALAGDELLIDGDQSLEEIVEGFKRGVAENLSSEDYDTHFNLGIAYREMGLLDEAIGEFQLAAKDPGYLVTCASMLGLCFLEKGLPELAVKWYRRGLEAPGIAEEEQLGLLYDLGNAQATAGDSESAYHTFVDLYGVNTNYRDVVARLAELEPRR